MQYDQREALAPGSYAICHDDCPPNGDCRIEGVLPSIDGKWSHEHRCPKVTWFAGENFDCYIVVRTNSKYCDAHTRKDD